MIIQAQRNGLVTGLADNLIPQGVIILQYADDTLLFLKNDITKAAHFKWLLACFENLSGMKVNYSKSDLLMLGTSEEVDNNFVRLFCCNL